MDPKKIRNVAIIAHDGAGKTALTEALLRHDAPSRASKDGSTSHLDADPEEAKRNFTVATHITYAEHDGVLLNLLDTAGFSDFLTDADRSMAVCEGGLLLVSAVSGVKHQTERHWEMAAERSLPLLACVNKLDKERASFLRALDDMEKALGARPVALQLPIGLGESFTGVIDLVSMRAHMYARRADGRFGGYIDEPIPQELMSEAKRLRARLVEAVAETDDLLLEKYLDGTEPSEEQLKEGIEHAVLGRRFLPVVACAARPGVGVRDVAQAMVDYLPHPLARREVKGTDPQGATITRPARAEAPPLLLAFRNTVDHFVGRLTVFRVFAGSVKPGAHLLNPRTGHTEVLTHLHRIDGHRHVEIPEAQAGDIVAVMKLKDVHVGDVLCDAHAPMKLDLLGKPKRVIAYALKIDRDHEERVGVALHKLLEEDPSLELVRDLETGETLLKGMGQVHVEVAVEKLKRKFDVEVHLELPHPAYHETISQTAKAQGRYKRQSGGRGQYGDCHLELVPAPRGSGITFEDAVVGGAVPRHFIPAVEHGIREAAQKGPLGQFPLVDFKARLVDGSFHTVDSSEMAFRIAGSMALKNALVHARPVLLEPMMRLEVAVPDEMLGEVIADLTARRGKILGMEPSSKGTLIHANAPHAELRTYAPELRSLTKGMGYFTMELHGYEEVPSNEAQRVLAARHGELEKDTILVTQAGKARA
ncbi:MAG: elongation factor G [Deltaproteobacteria bacterium]|nr:elongation factor G [Deltaproteobacteria bacterium]